MEGAFVHPILNENGEHGESYAEGFTVTLEEGTSDLVTTEVSLQLVEALDPNDQYRVRARMLEWVVTEEGGVHVERDLQTTAPHRYLHFANTESGDAAFNVHGTLDQAATSRLSLIETDLALDAIPIQVTYSLRRFDDWEDPIAVVPVGMDSR